MIYIISLLKFIGYECKGGVVVETDNKGAWELCHKDTSAQHTRHIDRKLFKLREMRGAGIVKVQYIPTDENTADLFTKVTQGPQAAALREAPQGGAQLQRRGVYRRGEAAAGCSTLRVEDKKRLLCQATTTRRGLVRQTGEPAVPPWRAHVGGNS